MRAAYPLLLLALASGPAWAQTPSQNPSQNTAPGSAGQSNVLSDQEQPEGRTHQRTQRIQVEDAGSRVNELRIGGRTQSISVQPKTGNLPSYEVQSPDGARSRSGSHNGAETTTAPRVWNVLKF